MTKEEEKAMAERIKAALVGYDFLAAEREEEQRNREANEAQKIADANKKPRHSAGPRT